MAIELNQETADAIYKYLVDNEMGEADLFWYYETLPKFLSSITVSEETVQTAPDCQEGCQEHETCRDSLVSEDEEEVNPYILEGDELERTARARKRGE